MNANAQSYSTARSEDELINTGPGLSHAASGISEGAILIGALLLVSLLSLVFVVLFRKRLRRRRHHRHRRSLQKPTKTATQTGGLSKRVHSSRRHHHHKRRRKRTERPSNPTLAETGGLPPRRPEHIPPPV